MKKPPPRPKRSKPTEPPPPQVSDRQIEAMWEEEQEPALREMFRDCPAGEVENMLDINKGEYFIAALDVIQLIRDKYHTARTQNTGDAWELFETEMEVVEAECFAFLEGAGERPLLRLVVVNDDPKTD
jgi:hypothetical protein